jgi:hypothetical protein
MKKLLTNELKEKKMPVIFYKNKAYGIGIVAGTIKSVNGKTPDVANNVTLDGNNIVKDATVLNSPAITEALDDEVTAREGADEALQDGIDGVQSGLEAETSAREAGDNNTLTSAKEYADNALALKQNSLSGTNGNVITYANTAGTVESLPIDTTVAEDSNNLVTSGAVFTAIEALRAELTTADG